MKTIHRVALAALGFLMVGASSLEAQRTPGREGRPRIDTTLAFARGGAVEVNLPGTDVTVRGGAGQEVRISGRADRGTLDIASTASRIRVGVDHTGGSSAGGEVEIVVPVGTRLRLSTQNGDVEVRGVRGELEVTTYNGDVDVSETGRTEIRTFTGDVEVRSVSGEIRVNSMSGDVQIGEAAGEVEVHTVSGDVDLRGVNSRFVRVRSTSGRLTYAGTIDGAGRYEFNSHSGSIRLALPEDVGAQLSIATFSGEIDSRFPLTLMPGDHGIGRPSGKAFTFELGRGEARISAESFSGDIILTTRAAVGSRRNQ
jgi:hypothetical protein